MNVKFWGVRGSIPVPGPHTVRSGGNTPCVEVQTSDREILILDAGTGIRSLGLDLGARIDGPLVAILLFSHTHWDHIQGLPFFSPAQRKQNRLIMLGERRVDRQLRRILASQMSDPYLPFTLDDLQADLSFEEIYEGDLISLGSCVSVLPRGLSHPGGVFGYRICCQDKIVVYATDVGHPLDGLDPRVVELARDANLLIHDAQFTPEERQERPEWGHSSWLEAVQVARSANVQHLALFHHDPIRGDAELDEIEGQARALFPHALLAREGMEIHL
jgi:phosphoribosyl 1,2-cyclic phosphodiesterase